MKFIKNKKDDAMDINQAFEDIVKIMIDKEEPKTKEEIRFEEEKELAALKQKVMLLEAKLDKEKNEETYADEQGRVYEVAQDGLAQLLEMYSDKKISVVKIDNIIFKKTRREDHSVYFTATTSIYSFAGKVTISGEIDIWGTGAYKSYINGIKSPSYGFGGVIF